LLQETVGSTLVPVLSDLVKVSTKALEMFGALPDPLKQTAVVIGGVGTVAALAVPRSPS
jgi:hypothetical protein